MLSSPARLVGVLMMQRDLVAARKALRHSLKELDSAEGDRARLQKQVNKLSRTLQVSSFPSPPPPLPLPLPPSPPKAPPFSAVLPPELLMQLALVAVIYSIPFICCISVADLCRLS